MSALRILGHMNKFPMKLTLFGLALFTLGIGLASADEDGPTEKIKASELFDVMLKEILEREQEIAALSHSASPSETGGGAGANVVLLFDVSRSVANNAEKKGLPMSRIKEEVVSLVDALAPSTRFNVVQFTRNYIPFQDSVVPADAANRKAFGEWVSQNWNDTGKLSSILDGAVRNPNGVLGVLKFTETMKPDMVYVISDASFHRGAADQSVKIEWSELTEAVAGLSKDGGKVPVNFIAFAAKPESVREMQQIAKQSGGQFREIVN